jgi:hypothetical protein
MVPDIDPTPVVKTGSFQVLVIHLETERVNQMETQLGGAAKPRDIARIGRDLGLMEHDMKEGSRHDP